MLGRGTWMPLSRARVASYTACVQPRRRWASRTIGFPELQRRGARHDCRGVSKRELQEQLDRHLRLRSDQRDVKCMPVSTPIRKTAAPMPTKILSFRIAVGIRRLRHCEALPRWSARGAKKASCEPAGRSVSLNPVILRRERWDDRMNARQEVLLKTSTEQAP